MKKYFVLLAVLALVFQPSLLLAADEAKKAGATATAKADGEELDEFSDFSEDEGSVVEDTDTGLTEEAAEKPVAAK